MGGRLLPLPLLLLLGAAGLELVESSSPGPLSSGPTLRAPTWPPSLAASSAGEIDSVAAEKTSGAGRREPDAPPAPGRSHPAATTAATRAQAWLSCSASPVHGSSPSPTSGGLPTGGALGGQRATSPSQGSGTGVTVDVRPPAAGAGRGGTRAAGTATAPPSLHPAGSLRKMQAEGGSIPHLEPPGPVTGAPLLSPTSSAGSTETPQEDVAVLIEHSGNAATGTVGPEGFPWLPVDRKASGETGRKMGPHTTSAVGRLPSGTAPSESRPPPRWRVGPGDMTPDHFPSTPRQTSLGQRTSVWAWQGPAVTPSAGVSRAAATDLLTAPGTGPRPAPSAALSHPLAEPVSPLSDVGQPPPNLKAAGRGTSSIPASGSSGTSAAGLSSDAPKRPPAAAPQDGFPHEAAARQASPPAGEATEAVEPAVRRALRKGGGATWRPPSPTESRASSVHWGAPRLQSQSTALVSRLAVAVPAGQVGDAGAFGPFSVTPPSWSTPARTWGGSRGDRSAGSPGSQAPPSLPLPTAGTGWHTWPPARGDSPVASTWLLAAVPEAVTQLAPAMPREIRPRGVQHVFVVENQTPSLKAGLLRLPWELVLALEVPRSLGLPPSPEYRGLLLSINATVAPLFAPWPGFQRLEVKSIRPGGAVVLLDALFLLEAPAWWAALSRSGLLKQPPHGLGAANASLVWSMALERPLDLCAELFSCPAGYDCLVGEDGNVTCASVCHRQYCKNQGFCTHLANQAPVCQCPVGSDFWFLGVRCDYRVTQQGLLGVACGLLLSLLLIGAAVFGLVVRRVRLLLLEARADQTKSSYRRFCRLDDVSAHYWSEPWLASATSLDNPAFSHSEELLHLQTLEPPHCSCQGGRLAAGGPRKPQQGPPASRSAAGRPRSLCSWERSSGSGHEHMIDSGKASEVSISSWALEPIQWSPSPAPQERPARPTHKSRRPRSDCEGMELISLERSWTA